MATKQRERIDEGAGDMSTTTAPTIPQTPAEIEAELLATQERLKALKNAKKKITGSTGGGSAPKTLEGVVEFQAAHVPHWPRQFLGNRALAVARLNGGDINAAVESALSHFATAMREDLALALAGQEAPGLAAHPAKTDKPARKSSKGTSDASASGDGTDGSSDSGDDGEIEFPEA
jgi:hypothetical protein